MAPKHTEHDQHHTREFKQGRGVASWRGDRVLRCTMTYALRHRNITCPRRPRNEAAPQVFASREQVGEQ
eukprot:scaffold276336_cov40-Tisochrysis_lutea.AAC.2